MGAALLALLLTTPLAAFDRGDVLLENRTHVPALGIPGPLYELWVHTGWRYAFSGGWQLLIHKPIPYTGPGRFLVPRPDQILSHHEQTVSVWDGVARPYWTEGKGYTEVFRHDTELSEIAPMRSGNFLVAEQWNDRGAKLIEFNLQGRVAEYSFPEGIDTATNRALGAMHIELLSDQCTVLYTLGKEIASNRVRRLNICTKQPQTDFASLVAGEYAGSIRQLPSGDILVANGSAVLQFTSQGSLVRSYQFPGVTHLALTTDGSAFWAAGVYLEKAHLRRFDLSTPDADPPSLQLGNDEMKTLVVPLDVADLVIVGEWRAALEPVKARVRAVRR